MNWMGVDGVGSDIRNQGEELPIVVRPAHDSDVHFILNSWLKSYKESHWFDMAGKVYWNGHRALILNFIGKCETQVACSVDDPETIVGWICKEGDVVHYVYVKKAFRRLGVARALIGKLAGKRAKYTHQTYNCNKLPIPEYWRFDPYVLLGVIHEGS